jgi:hypothetical protein
MVENLAPSVGAKDETDGDKEGKCSLARGPSSVYMPLLPSVQGDSWTRKRSRHDDTCPPLHDDSCRKDSYMLFKVYVICSDFLTYELVPYFNKWQFAYNDRVTSTCSSFTSLR